MAAWQSMVAAQNARLAEQNAVKAEANEQVAKRNAETARNNALKFYDFCNDARNQIIAGQKKLDDLGKSTEFGRLVSAIAQDVAQLPKKEDIQCGERPARKGDVRSG